MSECSCHGGITYTYTAGTLLGGMIELHVKTKNSSFLQNNNTIDFLTLALGIADSAIRFGTYIGEKGTESKKRCGLVCVPPSISMHSSLFAEIHLPRLMTKDGVLVEHCDLDQSCNLDQQIFKGIFVRNLR